MLAFDHTHGRFNYRTVGVMYHDNQVLLHRAEHEAFWSLPGGRVEFAETAEAALLREIQEELGVTAAVERLLWIVENFYDMDNRPHHELAFYFLVSLPADSDLYARRSPFIGDENGLTLIFQWFPVDQLTALELYPTFLRRNLQSLPTAIEHIVHQDP